RAADLAVDVAERQHGGVVPLDDVGQQVGEIGGVVARRVGRPGDVVVRREEDGVGPSRAGRVEVREGLLDGLATDGAVDLHDIDLDVGVGLLEGLRGGNAGRVDPDGDLAAGIGLFAAAAPGVG